MFDEEDKCFVCDRSSQEVKLFDAISGEEIVKICESCSSTEGIPIIRKPSSFQLKEAERPYSVYERLARAAGLTDLAKEKKEKEIGKQTASIIAKGITLDNLRKPRDFRKAGSIVVDVVKPEKPVNLIDNYHWYLQRARRARGLTTKQLADALGEAEMTVKMIEHAQLPSDYERVIRKIQQFLRIDFEKGRFFADRLPKSEVGAEALPIRKEETTEIVKSESTRPAARVERIEERAPKFNAKTAQKITIYDLYKQKEARQKQENEKKLQEEIEKGGIDSLKLSQKGKEGAKEAAAEHEDGTTDYEENRSMGFFKKLFSRKKNNGNGKSEEVNNEVDVEFDEE